MDPRPPFESASSKTVPDRVKDVERTPKFLSVIRLPGVPVVPSVTATDWAAFAAGDVWLQPVGTTCRTLNVPAVVIRSWYLPSESVVACGSSASSTASPSMSA